jgi:GNAT superfamily N-acetyltransferase
VIGEGHPDALEVKKVFVVPDHRSAGIARRLLAESEQYAIGAGFTALVLQTGPLQEAAIRLYERIGYHPIPPFGDYGVIPGALCFRKVLA